MALRLTWATVPLLLREVVELLLNSDAHKVQQRTVGAAAAKGEKGRCLLLDLPEGVIRRDADREIDGPTVAGAEEPTTGIRPEEWCLQQTFLCCQSEHRVRHAATLDPRGAHFRHHVAQPARVNPSTRSGIKSALIISYRSKTSRRHKSIMFLGVGTI